jgi:hypothetical protein
MFHIALPFYIALDRRRSNAPSRVRVLLVSRENDQVHVAPAQRSWNFGLAENASRCEKNSRLFEIAFVLVRFDHVARWLVNANHGMM